MAYSELIKNFNRIRDYMREFYVFGFKSRDEYTGKSGRSYDDERRRIESWIGDYMRFNQTPEGKNVFISIDSRLTAHNPLYNAWKTKSFTDGDITLHFILFDILSNPEICLSITEIMEKMDDYLSCFREPRVFDESTIRKKLKEYVSEGLLLSEKRGRNICYKRAGDDVVLDEPRFDALDYFSEVVPCGVIGSFLLDKALEHDSHFVFKHHYITGAMDSEVLFAAFTAIREKRNVTIESTNRNRDRIKEHNVTPLRVMVSVQSGRQYLMAYSPLHNKKTSFRTDNIVSVKPEEICPNFDEREAELTKMLPHIWGVSTQSAYGNHLEHVEFTVTYADDELHIRNRLEREKRCGRVEHIDKNTSRFSADVYDILEMVPWIRTFICRITELHFSNKDLEKRFRRDLRDMYAMYEEGGEE
ncbi:MAG: WYL domain-containing protein [Eubacteriales bacterium]|nr:WYL domain-containing protein [Eubacteriales bacterium]